MLVSTNYFAICGLKITANAVLLKEQYNGYIYIDAHALSVLCGFRVKTAYAATPQEPHGVLTWKQHMRELHRNSMF